MELDRDEPNARQADDGGEVDDDVGVLDDAFHQRFVADVALDEVEGGPGAKVEKPLLAGAVHKVVDDLDLAAGVEQMFAQDAAQVTEAAGDEDAISHCAHSMGYRGVG